MSLTPAVRYATSPVGVTSPLGCEERGCEHVYGWHLPSAVWLTYYGLWPDDDVSTRTTDVSDEEIALCL